MAGKTIYPSIPSPGNDLPSMRATLDAMRQSLTMITMNAQNPNPNFTPSTAAQIFVTQDQLKSTGVVGAQGPAGPQGPPGPGVAEAPNDTNFYARHALTWQPVLPIDCSVNLIPTLGALNIQVAATSYAGIAARDPSNAIGWHIALGNAGVSGAQQFVILSPSSVPVLWIGADGVIHVNAPIVVGP
jgi:hypothetical protein